ncbi:MAG TPA: hypothetical protein VMM82_12460 [Spirochaetia bacterium]|nr:hypothetical protein [Spirochaetia bacterium]
MPPALVWAVPPFFGALAGLGMSLALARLAVSRPVMEHAIRRLITTPRFLHETRQEIAHKVSLLFSLPLKDVASRTGAAPFLADHVLPFLAQKETRVTLARAVGSAARRQGQSLLTDDLVEGISTPLGRQLPVAVERIIEWMESEPMRETLAARGRELLPRILDTLNVMQRFLLSAGQFDRRLDEKMPEIVEETLQALERIMRDPVQQHALRDRILLAVRDWRDGPAAGEDMALPMEKVVDGYLESLGKPEARQAFRHSLEAYLTNGGLSLGAFLGRYAGLDQARVSDSVANAVLEWLSRPQASKAISARLLAGQNRLMKAIGIFGLALGLGIGLIQDILFLLRH